MKNHKTFKKGDKVFFLCNGAPVCAFVIDVDVVYIVVEEVISLVTRKITNNCLFSSREEAMKSL